MASNDSRPVNLDLTKFSFPITAIASIALRVSAVICWAGLGIALLVLGSAESAEDPLITLQNTIQSGFITQFIAWGILAAFGYYCAGTIKHIIQDIGYFEDLSGGIMISWVALAAGAVLAIVAGVYIWA